MVGRKVRLELDKAAAEPGAPCWSRRMSGCATRAASRCSTTSTSRCAPARSSASPAYPATGRASCSTCSPGIQAADHRARSSSDGAKSPRTTPGRPGRNARARAGARARGPAALRPGRRVRRRDETSVLGYHKDAPFSGAILLDHGAISDHCADTDGALRRAAAPPGAATARISPAATSRSSCWRASIAPAPRILLVGQPTRGVDIGAIEFIHRQLVAIRDSGCAVLVVSVELDEVMSLADRILVMCGGRIVGEVPGARGRRAHARPMMANIWTAPAKRRRRADHERRRATLPRWVEIGVIPVANVRDRLPHRGPDRAGDRRESARGRADHAGRRRVRLSRGDRLHALLHHQLHLYRSGGRASPSMPACSTSAARARPISAGSASAW